MGEITAQGATLKYGATEVAAAKIAPIKDVPEMMGQPELIEVTDLDNEAKRYILGISENGLKAFKLNYDKTVYAALVANQRTSGYYVLELSDGAKWTWQGQHVPGFAGGDNGNPLEINLYVVPSTVPAFTAGT